MAASSCTMAPTRYEAGDEAAEGAAEVGSQKRTKPQRNETALRCSGGASL